jgi:hypothetical protein
MLGCFGVSSRDKPVDVLSEGILITLYHPLLLQGQLPPMFVASVVLEPITLDQV